MTENLEIIISEGKKIKAKYNGFTIETDQSIMDGGQNSAPTPMSLFVASLGTCTGVVVKSFCDMRGINPEGITLKQEILRDESSHITNIEFKLSLPENFPEKYKKALLRAANSCTVKKHILNPPEIKISYI